MRAAEQATWEAAEIVKKEALEVALKKAQLEHDKQIRKINKEHQRAIKVWSGNPTFLNPVVDSNQGR